MADSTALKRRRGVVKASITRLATKVTELETIDHNLSVATRAQRLVRKLETLETDFKTHHFGVIDALDSEDLVGGEQDVLDQHDDDVAELHSRLEVLCGSSLATHVSSGLIPDRTIVERRLTHLQARLVAVN